MSAIRNGWLSTGGGWGWGGRCCAIHDGLSQNLADWLHIQENECGKQILNQHMLVLDQTSTQTRSISKPHERLKLLEGHIPAQALNELVIFLCMAMISSGGLLSCFIVKMICLIWHQEACSVHPTGEPGLICPTDGHMSGTNYLSQSDGNVVSELKQSRESNLTALSHFICNPECSYSTFAVTCTKHDYF